MSVFFNRGAQRELLVAYSSAQDLIEDALPKLRADIDKANGLLDARSALGALRAVRTFEDGVTDLALDRLDLSERAAFIERADARTAFLLGTTPGRLINPNLAEWAMVSGWSYDEALTHQQLALITNQQRPHTGQHVELIETLTNELAAIDKPYTASMSSGDLDSDLATARVGVPLRISAATPVDRGRQLLLRALSDTSNPDQLLTDEFGAYVHDNGSLTIVLPGVTDLSNPQLGNDPETNTLRDLDQQAIGAAYNTAVENNGYALRIVAWAEHLTTTGVIPLGTPTAIIGHSFGGDTAFDLAADEHFNGELLNVTHVFAAGYDTEAYFDNVPAHTRTMSARNIYDAVTFAEVAIRQDTRISTNRVTAELIEEVANLDRTALHLALRAFTHVRGRESDDDDRTGEASHNTGEASHDNRVVPVFIPPVELATDRVNARATNGTDISFEGNFDLSGFGHHPDDYADYLENAEAPDVLDFFVELDAQGFTDNAVALSIDISEPSS